MPAKPEITEPGPRAEPRGRPGAPIQKAVGLACCPQSALSFLSSAQPPSVRFLEEAAPPVLRGTRKPRDSRHVALGSLLRSLTPASRHGALPRPLLSLLGAGWRAVGVLGSSVRLGTEVPQNPPLPRAGYCVAGP